MENPNDYMRSFAQHILTPKSYVYFYYLDAAGHSTIIHDNVKKKLKFVKCAKKNEIIFNMAFRNLNQ